MGLNLKEKKAVTSEIVTKYAKSDKKGKSKILDGFVQITSYNRKYAISVLRKCFQKKTSSFNGKKRSSIKVNIPKHKKRVYPHYYDNEVLLSLSKIWVFFNFMCGQRLVPFIRENIETLASYEKFNITDTVKTKLCKISSATKQAFETKTQRIPRKGKINYKGRK